MTENNEPKIAGLLLAAGSSTRLGRPKQLVEWKGKTLIRRAAEALLDAGCSPVVVVLGAEIERSRNEIHGLGVEVVINEAWESGMGSSIAFGIQCVISAEPKPEAVLVSLCDQPYVTAEDLQTFLATFRETRPDVIAAFYNETVGVPALFSARSFADLAALKGKKGAREIIRNSPNAVTIPLPEAAIDVDSLSDLHRLH